MNTKNGKMKKKSGVFLTGIVLRVTAAALALLGLYSVVATFTHAPVTPHNTHAKTAIQVFSAPNTHTSFRPALLNALDLGNSAKLGSDNLICSPLSIQCALSALIPGADTDTLRELNSVLFGLALDMPLERHQRQGRLKVGELLSLSRALNTRYAEDPVLHSVQRVWINEELRMQDGYADFVGESARSLSIADASAAADTVNAWVGQHTNGMITQLVEPAMFPAEFVAAITDAIYFKGRFEKPFDAELTDKAAPFFTGADRATQAGHCQLMVHREVVLDYARTEQFSYVALDYRDSSLQLILALPNSDQFSMAVSLSAVICTLLCSVCVPQW